VAAAPFHGFTLTFTLPDHGGGTGGSRGTGEDEITNFTVYSLVDPLPAFRYLCVAVVPAAKRPSPKLHE
jgi:hypothetical protein